MITYLEPGILECEVKWALGSITMNKTSRDDGIPVELFQILKDDAVKRLHSTCQKNWKIEFEKRMRTREAKIAKNTAKVTSLKSQCNHGYCGQSQTTSASLHIKAQLEHSLP